MTRPLALTALAVTLAACSTSRPVETPAAAAPAAAPAATPAAAAAPAAAPAGTGSLRVELVAPSDRGALHVALFNSASTFLQDAAQTNVATPAGGKATVVFSGLAPGRYAVTVFQDADGNGEIGMGAMGPEEPWGYSGDRGGMLMGPPQWMGSSLEVGTTEAAMTITLRP